MKRAAIFSLFILVSLFGAGMRAQGNAPASPAPQQNALAPVEFLIGAWQAQGPTPGVGRFTAQRSYQRIFGGSFIEMREAVRGEKRNVAARAIIGRDPASGKLTTWAFADDGSMTEIVLIDAPAADGLVFEGKFTGGANPGPIRFVIRKTAAGFDEIIQVKHSGQWSDSATTKFSRAAGAPVPVFVTARPLAGSRLGALEKFTGTWLIEGESEGRKFTVEYAYLWTLGGRFMTTTYSVGMGGAPQLHAMSFIGHDPQSKQIVQRGFNAEGSVLRATVVVTANTLVWEGQMTGAESRSLRSTYRLVDADTLEFTTEIKKGAAWESMGTAPMRRKKP